MKTAKKDERAQPQNNKQENVQEKLELAQLMDNSRKTSFTQRQKIEI